MKERNEPAEPTGFDSPRRTGFWLGIGNEGRVRVGLGVSESLHELAGQAQKLALGRGELFADHSGQPDVALMHVGVQYADSGGGELEPGAAVILGVGGAPDQSVVFEAGQGPAERLGLDAVGCRDFPRAQRPAAVEMGEDAELLYRNTGAGPLSAETASESHRGTTHGAGRASSIIVHIRTLARHNDGFFSQYRRHHKRAFSTLCVAYVAA